MENNKNTTKKEVFEMLGSVVKKVSLAAVTFMLAMSFVVLQSADAAGGVVKVEDVTPFKTEPVGGGIWDHWIEYPLPYKAVYSYYFHETKVHGSSARLGSNPWTRDCVRPNYQSRASQMEIYNGQTAYAAWNTSCTNPR
jgi:hypothetical protein